MELSEKTLLQAVNLATLAGQSILQVYEQPFDVEFKEDKSPLTLADKVSNLVITSGLKVTDYPNILSEESAVIPYEKRKDWEWLWIVDPLDGTKEFVKRNGEFTVNIALIHEGLPVFGIIYIPVTGVLYFAIKGQGAFKVTNAATMKPPQHKEILMQHAEKLPLAQPKRDYTVVASRSHMSPETEAFIEEQKKKHGTVQTVSAGSSIKFCLIAEGKADTYPRFAPTMEWDTAAGQIIVEETGKRLLNMETNKLLTYNRLNLTNPHFLVTT